MMRLGFDLAIWDRVFEKAVVGDGSQPDFAFRRYLPFPPCNRVSRRLLE